MSQEAFKGALRYKKKSLLLEIAEALEIDLVPASRGGHPSAIKREEFESLIKDHLKKNKAKLAGMERWAGLYEAMENEEKRSMRNSIVGNSVRGGTESSDISDDSPEASSSARSPRKHAGPRASSATRASSRSSLANGISSLTSSPATTGDSGFTSALAGRARRSIEGLREKFLNGVSETRDEIEDVVEDVEETTNTMARKIKTQYRKVIKDVNKQFKSAQSAASDSSNITKTLIAIEALILLFSVTPTRMLSFSGNQHLSASKLVQSHGRDVVAGSIPKWGITILDPMALISFNYWQSILLWGFWTVVIPMFFAHLITFDRKHQASTLTFGLVRLFSILYLAFISTGSTSMFSSNVVPPVLGVAAGQPSVSNIDGINSSVLGLGLGWLNYENVTKHIGVETQLLLTAVMTSFSLYETIAVRPRA